MALDIHHHVDPVEDKYGFENLSYEGLAGKKMSSVSSTRDYFSKSTQLSASIKGTSEKDMEDAKKLLEKAGFVDVEIKSHGGASSFSVSAYEKDGKGLAAFVAALATDHDLGRGETLFALMNKKDAEQIVTEELKRQNLSFQQAGLASVSVMTMDNTGGQRYGVGVQAPSYKDVDLRGYPFGVIDLLREDGFPSKFAVEKHTDISVRDGQGTAVEKQLKDAGFETKRSPDGSRISVNANLDAVAQTLGKSGFLPNMMVQEIKDYQPPAPAAPAAPAVSASAPKVASPGMGR